MSYIPTQPSIMAIPFCSSGEAAAIPVTETSPGRASLTSGFPAITMTPIAAGGIAPNGTDFNGILNWLSEFCTYIQSGGLFLWNAELNYAPPAITVGSNGQLYACAQPSGVDVSGVGPKDPINNVDYWTILPTETDLIIGDIKLFPFRSDELPGGWYFCDGTNYALTSAQGQALDGLNETLKTNFRIAVSGADPDLVINTPNLFAADGTGATFTPANGVGLSVGQLQEDTGRRVSGSVAAYYTANWTAGSGCIGLSGGAASSGGNVGWTSSGLTVDSQRNWGADHTGSRFKVYGVGMTPAIFLGV